MGSPKRLLYCSSVAPQRTGAGELLVHRHLTSLTGWDIMTVGPENRPAEGEFREKITIGSSRAVRSLVRLRRGKLWSMADRAAGSRVVAGFARAADRFKPDVVVSVMLHDLYFTAAALYAERHRIPLVLFCHDDYEEDVPPGGRRHLGNVYRQAAARLCVSQVMEREFKRRYGVAGQVLPPIPGRMPNESRGQSDDDVLTIGYAGSVSYGCEQAMVSLADALGRCGGRLVIASRNPRTIAERVWIHPAVTDLGAVDPESLEWALMQAGVNALAIVQSFDPEEKRIRFNFPSKFTEYMMLGLPILMVGPEYASVPLWLKEHPGTGILVTRQDVDAFTEPLAQLQQAAERRALAARIGEVAERYSPKVLNEHFEEALLATLGVCRASSSDFDVQ